MKSRVAREGLPGGPGHVNTHRNRFAAVLTGLICLSLLVLLCGIHAAAETTTWDGSSGYWSNDLKWDHGVPQDNDEAVVNAGTVTVSSPTAALTSYTHNGGVLLFTNWSTRLQAATVTLNGGSLTHAVCNISADPGNTNRVWIVCSNLTVEAGGLVDVNEKGYIGGLDGTTTGGQGTGGGGNAAQTGGGGSYGGTGGNGWLGGAAGPIYGAANAPTAPGSGGGASTVLRGGNGGAGGGAVRIEADGAVTINGTVTARGGRGTNVPDRRGAGGSGGAVYITCNRLAGINGLVAADGGSSLNVGGGGGGGRIALNYNETAQRSGLKPRVRFSCARGLTAKPASAAHGDLGTFHAPSDAVLDGVWLPHTAQLVVPAFASGWVQDRLLVTNGWVRFIDAGFHLVVSNNLTVSGTDGILEMPAGGQIHCGGDLTLERSGRLHVYSAPTNSMTPDYGALVAVTGTLRIADSCWVYPHSDGVNGGSPLFSVGALSIAAGGGIDADGTGYRGGYNTDGYGPGKGRKGTSDREGSGAGHGGGGGRAPTVAGGGVYGQDIAPHAPGSGGGSRASGYGCAGGGLIRIQVAGDSVIDGTLRADGGAGMYGGGAGGGIWLLGRGAFSGGASALLRSAGSAGSLSVSYKCGAGGGGRIAIWENVPESEDALILAGDLKRVRISATHPKFQGVAEAPGATTGYAAGSDGSVMFLVMRPPVGTIITIR